MATLEYLSGVVYINTEAPNEWTGQHVLPFWENPNDERWSRSLCRELYHETTHFWQILSSSYIAAVLSEEWLRLLEFEKTGVFKPQHQSAFDFNVRKTGIPFSNYNLSESWARYWDIHTHSPARIIQEENIESQDGKTWEIIPPDSTLGKITYTGDAFDTVMQVGQDCQTYGMPYRWLLNTFKNDSAFVAVLFPIITHSAFGSPDPATFFCNAYDRAWYSDAIRSSLNNRTGNINLDWFLLWPIVMREAVVPTLNQLGFQSFRSGLDVINNGPLSSHPVFYEYLYKIRIIGFLKLYRPLPINPDTNYQLLNIALVEMPKIDPLIPFALPGQPFYRSMLGNLVPPPIIQFNNFTWSAHRPIELKMDAANTGNEFHDTFENIAANLDLRVKRLFRADKAVELGLSHDAFEART